MKQYFTDSTLRDLNIKFFTRTKLAISAIYRKSIWPVEAKLDFENYKGNELEVAHFGPIIEAERDETLGQYLQIMVTILQSILLDLRHLRIRPSRHPINVPLAWKGLKKSDERISHIFHPKTYNFSYF